MSLEAGICFSTGYNFMGAKSKEDELKQGTDYYRAANCQSTQIYNLSTGIDPLIDKIPHSQVRVAAKVCNQVVPVLSVALCPLFAVVKKGHYEMGVKAIKGLAGSRLAMITYLLPDKLSKRTEIVYCYLAENTGNIMEMGMLATAVAIPILTSPYYAAAMVAPVIYGKLDSMNVVPRRLSLFVETYMPTVTNLTFLAGGNLLSRVVSTASLLYDYSQFNRFVHRKFDNCNQYFSGYQGPKLEEFEAPLVVNHNPSFVKINEILDGDDEEYEINPAHCSKPILDFGELPKERDLTKLIPLMNSIEWEKRYSILKSKFRDDDRFINDLKFKFPGNSNYQTNFETYLEQLAKESSVSKEKYLADLLRGQMLIFVSILTGKRRVKGSQQHLQETINNTSKILAYLLKLDTKLAHHRVELEDILMKLSIECGDYCSSGSKRASGEIVNSLILQVIESKSGFLDPIQNYEFLVRFSLQRLRTKFVDSMYLKYIESYVLYLDRLIHSGKEGGNAKFSLYEETTHPASVTMAQDIITYDTYRKIIALGFIPLTDSERNSIGIFDTFTWGSPFYSFREMRNIMCERYRKALDATVKEIGEVYFGPYIRQLILKNNKLSKDQKSAILDKFLTCNDGKWSVEVTQQKFHRLMFVMLGILRQQKVSGGWVNIGPKEISEYEKEQHSKAAAFDKELSEWTHVSALDADG